MKSFDELDGKQTFILCASIIITTLFLPGMTGIYGFVAPFIGWIGGLACWRLTDRIKKEEVKDAASEEVKKLKTKRAITLVLTIVLVIVFFHSCSYEGGGERREPKQVLSNEELEAIDDALGGTLSDKYDKYK